MANAVDDYALFLKDRPADAVAELANKESGEVILEIGICSGQS